VAIPTVTKAAIYIAMRRLGATAQRMLRTVSLSPLFANSKAVNIPHISVLCPGEIGTAFLSSKSVALELPNRGRQGCIFSGISSKARWHSLELPASDMTRAPPPPQFLTVWLQLFG